MQGRSSAHIDSLASPVTQPHFVRQRTPVSPNPLLTHFLPFGAIMLPATQLNRGAMTDIWTVRLAQAGDESIILGLIDEAAAWLQAMKETNQWSRPWPNRAARDERVARGIAEGRTWMVEDAGTVIGTVTYRKDGNRKLWKRKERRDPAVYVSRLIIARAYAGLGIGASLVDWAGLRGAREWNASSIRVDVWTTNTALHNYYEKHGFRAVRTRQFHDPWKYPSGALFQKPVSEIDERAAGRFEEVQAGLLPECRLH